MNKNEQLKAYVHTIFAPYQDIKSANEFEEELLQNLLEKYSEHKQNGYSDQDAYQMTIDSVGDVSELIDTLNLSYNELEEAIQMNFSKQRLTDSDFQSVSVHDGKFNYSNLKRSDFSNSDLKNSTFKGSDLTECTFENANLTKTLFRNSNLNKVTFNNCIYVGTYFKRCNLTGLVFDGETFRSNVQFRGNDLKKADFNGATMDQLTYNFLKASDADLSNVIIHKGGL
ncbi:pentapeptide repeat-containing protein [Virgibacillus oceani]|uniref:Low-complexity protein n=1 Tax=Virgibacillus oceani TaxID=1479511 RepID=A0A917HHY6_9BACI|nr:pentapeptide repeat-containing protein [Virgibacillus oceani]GGG80311.1 hypothetical protein GCM10011398_27110 [Virgibacillus oceani]